MAALNAASIAYAIQNIVLDGLPPRYHSVVDLTLGDGSSTYPAGGVPITATSLGLPQGQIISFAVLEQTGGVVTAPVANYNPTANKLQFFVASTSGTNQHLTEATTAYAPAAMTLRCEAIGY